MSGLFERGLQFNFIKHLNSNQNVTMEKGMQILLKDFYFAVLLKHQERKEKIQGLDNYFSKFNNSLEVKTDVLKQNKECQYETLASIGDIDPSSIQSQNPNTFSSNMLYTFLLSNQSNRDHSLTQNCSKIISRLSFTDFSFLKVVLYAIFINFLHINKQVRDHEHHDSMDQCLNFAEQTLKKVKIAMVSAAQSFKTNNKKKYIKIRYLYDQLMSIIEKDCAGKQDYIKVIVQQFEEDFIKKTFDNLKLKNNQLHYSQSICSTFSLEDSVLRENQFIFDTQKALEYLKVKLILMKDNRRIEVSKHDFNLNIVIEQMPNGAFKLKQIISSECSDQLNRY